MFQLWNKPDDRYLKEAFHLINSAYGSIYRFQYKRDNQPQNETENKSRNGRLRAACRINADM